MLKLHFSSLWFIVIVINRLSALKYDWFIATKLIHYYQLTINQSDRLLICEDGMEWKYWLQPPSTFETLRSADGMDGCVLLWRADCTSIKMCRTLFSCPYSVEEPNGVPRLFFYQPFHLAAHISIAYYFISFGFWLLAFSFWPFGLLLLGLFPIYCWCFNIFGYFLHLLIQD